MRCWQCGADFKADEIVQRDVVVSRSATSARTRREVWGVDQDIDDVHEAETEHTGRVDLCRWCAATHDKRQRQKTLTLIVCAIVAAVVALGYWIATQK